MKVHTSVNQVCLEVSLSFDYSEISYLQHSELKRNIIDIMKKQSPFQRNLYMIIMYHFAIEFSLELSIPWPLSKIVILSVFTVIL